jgi:hypothetical protein
VSEAGEPPPHPSSLGDAAGGPPDGVPGTSRHREQKAASIWAVPGLWYPLHVDVPWSGGVRGESCSESWCAYAPTVLVLELCDLDVERPPVGTGGRREIDRSAGLALYRLLREAHVDQCAKGGQEHQAED